MWTHQLRVELAWRAVTEDSSRDTAAERRVSNSDIATRLTGWYLRVHYRHVRGIMCKGDSFILIDKRKMKSDNTGKAFGLYRQNGAGRNYE